MKIIFLDIDGVLNNGTLPEAFFFILKQAKTPRAEAKELRKLIIRDEFGNLFCPTATRALKSIIEKTDAQIVISSTWRMSGLSQMQIMWEMRDLPGKVIDVTPSLNTPRGEEIECWLKNNQVDSYVIIDDDRDMLPEQIQNFVKTDSTYGLTFTDADKAINILNGK